MVHEKSEPRVPTYQKLLTEAGVSLEYQAGTNDQYRALGRFHYQFSRLVWSARFTVQKRRTYVNNKIRATEILNLLNEGTAGRSINSWLQYCQEVYDHDEKDLVIASALKKEFDEFNRLRNFLTHGDVHMGYGASEDSVPIEPQFHKIKVDWKIVSEPRLASVESLDKLTDDLSYHRRRLADYANLCLDQVIPRKDRPGTRFTIRKGRVELTTPHSPIEDISIWG